MMIKFRAKYNSTGFRGQSWRIGMEVEMTHDEFLNDPCAKHFEPLINTDNVWPVVIPEQSFKEQLKHVEVAPSLTGSPPPIQRKPGRPKKT